MLHVLQEVWLARLTCYMSGSNSIALCVQNVQITVYDVTTWSWVNLVNPVAKKKTSSQRRVMHVVPDIYILPGRDLKLTFPLLQIDIPKCDRCGRIFFWTRFENLATKRREIIDRVVPILVAIRNWNHVICTSRSEKVAEFAQCVAP